MSYDHNFTITLTNRDIFEEVNEQDCVDEFGTSLLAEMELDDVLHWVKREMSPIDMADFARTCIEDMGITRFIAMIHEEFQKLERSMPKLETLYEEE